MSSETQGGEDTGVSLDGQNNSSNSAENNANADQSALGGDGGDGGASKGRGPSRSTSKSTSPLVVPLSTRIDLYRRLRQGLVATEDLLPETMLAAAKAFSTFDSICPSGAPLRRAIDPPRATALRRT